MLEKLNDQGISPDKEDVTVRAFLIEVSKDHPEDNPVVNQVLIPMYRGNTFIGGAIFTHGEAENTVFSTTQVEESDAHDIYYVEDGKVEYMLVRDGEILKASIEPKTPSDQISTQAVSCMGICGSICGAGFGSQIGTCISRCRLAGPGYWWCLGLCAVIVGTGCVVGCDRLCNIFNS